MTSTPFYLGDIVRSKSTGIEGRIASVSSQGGRILVGGGYLSVPRDDGEVITPAAVLSLIHDEKFLTWLSRTEAAAIRRAAHTLRDQGVFDPDAGYVDTYEPSHVRWLEEYADGLEDGL